MIEFSNVWNDCPICGSELKLCTNYTLRCSRVNLILSVKSHYYINFNEDKIDSEEFWLFQEETNRYWKYQITRNYISTTIKNWCSTGYQYVNISNNIDISRFIKSEEALKKVFLLL